MNQILENVNCNICGSYSYKKFDKIKSIFPEYLKGEYTLVKCTKCELVYLNPRPSKSIISHLYTSGDYMSHYNPRPYDISRLTAHVENKKYSYLLDNLEKYIEKGRILDIGMGWGLLLKAAKDRGWQVFGIEASSQQIQFAKSQLNIDCSWGIFEEADFSENSFDVATMDNVLEYTLNPKNLLLKINRLLSNDGIVVIRTPNIDGLYYRMSRFFDRIYNSPRKYGYQSERVSLQYLYEFNITTLGKLLEITGFKVVQSFTIQLNRVNPKGDFGLRKIFKKIINFLGNRLSGWGDQCVVYARKQAFNPIEDEI